MANQGLLAQLKPTGATDTVLYRAPIDASASTVLTVANDGTGAAYDVAVKDYDQKLTLDASTYKLHQGDIISSYYVTLNTNMSTTTPITGGQSLTTTDQEKTFKFESFYVPEYTEIFVKSVALRQVTVESVIGEFVVGQTISKGTSPDDTTAIVYAVDSGVITIGPSTINGGGTEFTDGDSISVGLSVSATISVSGVAAAANKFVFSTTTVGGTYGTNEKLGVSFFDDRAYRFDVSDSSMSGLDFKLSTTVNGEWGPDGLAPTDPSDTGDGGTEYTTGKTTNGTPGVAGAYVQYDFLGSNIVDTVYYYEGDLTTAANASYGGTNRKLVRSQSYTYPGFYIYDKVGTISNNVDSFTFDAVTYTITNQSAGAYGYVKDYTGTTLKFVKGLNSGDFSGTDTFRDVPKLNSAIRDVATVSAVDVASDAVEASNYITEGKSLTNNNVDRITSLVVGPGEVVVVNSATANNVFSLVGFEDNSDSITTRVFGQS